jgi:cell division protein FtsL
MAAPVPLYLVVIIIIVAILVILLSHMIRSNMEEQAVKEYHDNVEHAEKSHNHNYKSNAGDPLFLGERP